MDFRLFLLGGVEGFLKEMARHNVEPDIKTISLLLECIPDTCTAENVWNQLSLTWWKYSSYVTNMTVVTNFFCVVIESFEAYR